MFARGWTSPVFCRTYVAIVFTFVILALFHQLITAVLFETWTLTSVCFSSDMELYYEICMLQAWDCYPNWPKKLWICYYKRGSTQNGGVWHRGCWNICPSCRWRFWFFNTICVPSTFGLVMFGRCTSDLLKTVFCRKRQACRSILPSWTSRRRSA